MIKLAAFAALVVCAAGFLFYRSPLPKASTYTLDLKEVREMVAADLKPEALASLQIGTGTFPGWFVIAGNPLAKYPIDWRSYLIRYPDGETVLIDPVHDQAFHKEFPFSGEYFHDNYLAMQKELRVASLVLCTHEHWDHIGGVSQSPYFNEVATRIALSGDQIDSAVIGQAKFADGQLAQVKRLDYKTYHRVSPGIVLIKAPGHTPGNQLIYTQLANGKEVIFAGDIAYNQVNLEREQGRSWFGSLLSGESPAARRQVNHQLRTLIDLEREGIALILAHDQVRNQMQIDNGLLKPSF